MRYKHNKLENHRIKLSTIVERLPLYRFLDQSRATVLKLQPVWQAWLGQQLPDLDPNSAYMSGYDANTGANTGTNTLIISANNASTAALIKHQKSTLLTALNTGKAVKISTIKVRIDLTSTLAVAEQQHQNRSRAKQEFNAPNQKAIDSVERLKTSIKNPDLADTIGNLAKTLRQLSDKAD